MFLVAAALCNGNYELKSLFWRPLHADKLTELNVRRVLKNILAKLLWL